jgi:hypothetical protein
MEKRQEQKQSLPVINPNAAGIDIGSTFHVVEVSPGRVKNRFRLFNHLQQIYIAWSTGSSGWVLQQSPWNPQVFTGFRSMKNWKVVGYG